MKCSVAGCSSDLDENRRRRGMCGKHYQQWWKANGRKAPRPTPAERFWSKVAKADACWLWTAACIDSGYGHFYLDGQLVLAHRWAFEQEKGPIPQGLVLDHLCRNRRCVRPDHLEPVTNLENIRRGIKGQKPSTCSHGHRYTPDNTRIDKRGRRHCLICQAAYNARRRAQYKEKKTS